jgi:tetratricopeptide (TPR) repeat protein
VIYLIGGDILLNQQQDLMRANQLLQRSLKLQPTLARARILLANHALTSSHFYRAEQFLNPLLNQYHPQALLLLAQLQMALGMLRQAHQTLQQLLRKHPNHIRGRLFSATLLYQFLRQPKMAYKQLSQLNLSEMDPSLRSEIILHRGYIELMEGQAKRALKLAEALIEQNKNDFPAQFLKAQILVLEKQYKKAESVMQLLNTRISADAPLQTFLALIQEHLGKTTEAMQLYTQIADQNTRYIWPRILLAASLLRQKKYTQAMLQLNRHALDIEPDVFQQQQTISRFYLVPQIWNDTLLFFQQAKTGDVAIVRAAAGMTAYHAGNVALAYKLLRHSLQIDARGLSANLYLAQYYYEINKLDVAKRHATNAYKIYNRHPIAAQILGWIAYKRQQYDLAMTYFTQVRQARPWFVSSIIGQALILAHRNEQKKAINMLRRLLTTYPHHSLLAHAMHQLKQ